MSKQDLTYTKLDHPKGASLGYRRSSKTYIARVYHDGAYRTKSLGRVDKKVTAARLAQEFAYAVRDGVQKPLDVHTLEEVIESYLDDLRGNGEPRLRRKSEQAAMRLDALVGDDYRKRKAALIRLADVRAIQRAYSQRTNRSGAPVSPDSVNRVMSHLIAALNHGHRMEMIPDDSGWKHYARLESAPIKRRVEPLLSDEQQAEFIDACPPALQAFVRATHYLGARPSEIVRLRREHVDLDAGAVTITMYKGKTATRTLPLPAGSAVRELFEQQIATGNDVIFPTPSGRAWSEKYLSDCHKKVRDDLELPADMTAYSWRHNRITRYVRAGVNIVEIADFCGTSVEHIQSNYYKTDEATQASMASMA